MMRPAIRFGSRESAFLSVAVQFGLPSTILLQKSIVLFAITGLLVIFPESMASTGVEILGLRLGMDVSEVAGALEAKGIAPIQQNEETMTAKGPPVPLQGIREMKCSFKSKKLGKVVLSFEIPPYEASATKLIQRYENEKARLQQRFGMPSKEAAFMEAPEVQDRYEWLRRGRGYYLSIWERPEDQVKISLWLFGEDAGIVLVEIYERP